MTKVWTREGSRSIENLREDKEQGYFGGISNNKIHSHERNLYGKKKKKKNEKGEREAIKIKQNIIFETRITRFNHSPKLWKKLSSQTDRISMLKLQRETVHRFSLRPFR